MIKKLHNINCKHCQAPLKLQGNYYRSKTLTCHYCGTVMDSQHDFKALYTFTHIQHPDANIQIGNEYTFQNINFKTTGFIAFKSREKAWLHFQLYSPTHGYAQLIQQDGEYIFLRKTYYLPEQNLWMLKQGDPFTVQQTEYQIQNFHFSEIYYAEGSLTMSVQPGKRIKQCFAKQGNQWFISIQQRGSVEYFQGYKVILNKNPSLRESLVTAAIS
jgi:hypothetical protein